jgi:hypothetical protein
MPALAFAPNSSNLLLGRGKLYFDRFVTGTTTKQGELDLGNCTAFDITPKPTIKKKYESMDPSSLLYSQAVTQQDVTLKVTGDEFAMFNLAAVLLGNQAQLVQSATSTITAAALTSAIVNGAWYPTGYRSITVTDVKQGSTTGVLGTDYNVDATTGRIQLFTTGVFTASTATTWDGSSAAVTYNMVQGSTVGLVEGYLRFIGNPVKGPVFEAECWHVSFTPTGNLALIADDFGNWTLDGALLPDLTRPSEPYFHLIQRA